MENQREIVFEVSEAPEGGYTAEAIGESIFTQAETWEELRANVQDATRLHFEGEASLPVRVTLLLRRVESMAVA